MTGLGALRRAAAAREAELPAAVREGRQVVGLVVPGAPPAEIVEACGAWPWRLLATGGPDAEVAGMSLLGRDACGFCRSVFGRAARVPPPVSLVAAGTACDRLRRALDALPAATGLPFYPVAVPRVRTGPGQRQAMAAELALFARELSLRTGTGADPDRLGAAIRRGNRVRAVLGALDAARRGDPPRLTGEEYLDAVRAAHALDSETFLEAAGEVIAETARRAPPAPRAVRVLLVGPTLADGRRETVTMLEGAGATVVADLTDSGALGCGEEVSEEGDPFEALAAQVLALPAVAAPLRPATALRERFERAVVEARPEGVVFRGLPFCRPWNAEVAALRERCPVPFLAVQDDGSAGIGQLRTRLGAFVETLAARRGRGRGA